MKKLIILLVPLFLTGCFQTIDNQLYKYGNGIKGAIDGVGTAYACVATGGMLCGAGLGVKGYIEGKQQAREYIEAKDNRAVIKRIAEDKADVKCGWWDFGCE